MSAAARIGAWRARLKEGVLYLMSVNWQRGRILKTKLEEMQQTLEILRRLRDGRIVLPDSVLLAIDNAIVESEKQLTVLKNTLAN
jgi:hypothetical protein